MAEVSNAERKYVKVIPVSKNLGLQTALTKAFPTFFFFYSSPEASNQMQKLQHKCKNHCLLVHDAPGVRPQG